MSHADAANLEFVDQSWRRVSPKYIIVDVVGYIVFGVIAVAAVSLPAYFTEIALLWAIPASLAIIFLITIVLTPRRVRAIGYQLRQDDLLYRRGIMFQRFVAVPYGRMQLVDINRGPLMRALDLAELKFVTAAAATGVTLPGLPLADAEALRDQLVSLAESRRAGL
ncbi:MULTISPECIES: PH domain-containing protein [unclassified Salinibacterium]|uniref:PH domain-containing protein n=1 Tax=unclassified Salinibacterium TaxID=2632331 RepID=UPI001420C199|nr:MULTISPECIES: PH domain-containing protein [unclassified Salinibacterium]